MNEQIKKEAEGLVKEGRYYRYKDGRVVFCVQAVDKLKRAEVIIGNWNPFWVNYSDLIPPTKTIHTN